MQSDLLEDLPGRPLLIEKGLMKKNAIVIASIMFVSGCASPQARYSSDYSDPSLSARSDPATGGYASGVSGSESYDHHNNTSVNDFHADSSVRGGSNEARGWAERDFLSTEGTPQPINPAIQADSSIRGGSNEARSGNSYHSSNDQPIENPD